MTDHKDNHSRRSLDRRSRRRPPLKYLIFGGRRMSARRDADKNYFIFVDRYSPWFLMLIVLLIMLSLRLRGIGGLNRNRDSKASFIFDVMQKKFSSKNQICYWPEFRILYKNIFCPVKSIMISRTWTGNPSVCLNVTAWSRGMISSRQRIWLRSGLDGGWGVSVNCSGVSVFQ